ncbi:carboxypeptidase-like regulatory domain-containing protein [Virgisporangium aliadipatigenens]|uniref:carboxypeptidase-like regulatory domain-containing protein n=1 Tax=Virgisporangium aliadipatigenens TaxID=741659 RepID=UPI00194203D8|nr:carboxypeptidase-like regulatory domain-containing protein [Virgisporangium aliadipatigenens]
MSGKRFGTLLLVAFISLVAPAVPAQARAANGTIGGIVTTADGTPASGASVSLYRPGPNGPVQRATAGADGRYSFSVAPGAYVLSFQSVSLGAEQWSPQKLSPFEAREYPVADGATTVVDEALLASGTFAGTLTDSAGAPVASSRVSVFLPEGRWIGGTMTDSAGQYRVAGIPVGRYQLSFIVPGTQYLTQWAPRVVTQPQAGTYAVAANAVTTVDERLLPTGTLAVRPKNTDGTALVGASVSLSADSGAYVSGSTDASGVARMLAFAGTYRVGFRTPDWTRGQYLYGAKRWDDATPIAVAADTVTEVTDTLLPTASLRVTATDAVNGAPVTDFCASALDEGIYGCSGGSGVVLLAGVTAGPTTVHVSSEDGLHDFTELAVTAVAGATVDVSAALQPMAVFTTVIRAADTDAPLTDACVALVTAPASDVTDESFRFCSDSGGTVRIPTVPAGDYKLFVRAPRDSGYGAQWVGASGGTGDPRAAKVVQAVVGQVTTLSDIRLDRAGTITGRVTEPDGTPAVYGAVNFASWHPGPGPNSGLAADVAADGSYTFGGLGPYEWPLLFSAKDKPRQWSGNAVDRDQAARIVVTAGGTTTYDITLRDGTTVTGTTPVEDHVIIRSAATGEIVGVAWPVDGTYTAEVLGPQDVRVQGGAPVAVPSSGTVVVNL